ncbi:MAG TPA: DUF5752 family protein [Thermodesulfovibrionales bacterium]|jgi:hypothetical protein|nr:DUF5752 family protein [Thermodesulfovibrionales bacterium]
MAEITEPFEFRQCSSLLKATGKKAKNIGELKLLISAVSDDSIFHHTYQYFLKGHILEYTSDFSQWAGESLEESALAERLANIDPYDFRNIDDLRNELIRVIDEYIRMFPEPREAMPGDEFYFHETVTLIFPLGIRARNLAEFLTAMKYINTESIYYHFYEARIRLGGGIDDFSRWIEDAFGKKELAARIRAIDPFMHSLESIKEHIIEEVEEEVKRDMEVIDRCLTSM